MQNADRLQRSLTFAVRLRDEVTGRPSLLGRARVFVVGRDEPARPSPSGYFPFCDLDGQSFTVRVETEFYFDAEAVVDTSLLDARNPVVRVAMQPNPRYPFGAAATLVRGIVVDPHADAVPGATVTIAGSERAARSWQDGRFALHVAALQEEDVTTVDGRRFFQVAGETALSLRVVHPSFASRLLAVGRVEESRTKLLAAPIVLSP